MRMGGDRSAVGTMRDTRTLTVRENSVSIFSLLFDRPSPDYVPGRYITTGLAAHPCRSHPHDLQT
jgi:hypothetical protein